MDTPTISRAARRAVRQARRQRVRRVRIGRLAAALAILCGLFVTTGADPAVPAPPKALINASTTSGPGGIEQQVAESLGYEVTSVDDATWGSMTAADFGQYDLLIVADTGGGGFVPGLVSSAPVWGSVVMGQAGGRTLAGNRVVVGTDASAHAGSLASTRSAVIREGITYAASQPGRTNMFFTTSDGYSGGGSIEDDSVSMLTAISGTAADGVTGSWTASTAPPCGGSVSLIAANPAFVDTTTASLEGWGCSVHVSFPTFPSDWSALAVATDTATKPTCGIDPNTNVEACGEAYILVAGSEIVVRSLVISVTPEDATNPTGTTHTVTANVHQAAVSPPYVGVPGQKVDFVVTGQNAGAAGTCVPADCTSDANGDVSFTYQDTNGPGDDTIKASFRDAGNSLQSATAQKHWVSGGGHSVTVTVVGPGGVTSAPAGIDCPTGACSASFADGTVVDLSAIAGSGATFTGWSGDCTGSGPCQVTTDADRNVTATFVTGPVTKLETKGDGETCDPDEVEFDFDNVEYEADGSLVGKLKLEGDDDEFRSTGLTSLGFTGHDVGLFAGTGKFNGVDGYKFAVHIVDGGAAPDMFGFEVSDSSGAVVWSSALQPICEGKIKIHDDEPGD